MQGGAPSVEEGARVLFPLRKHRRVDVPRRDVALLFVLHASLLARAQLERGGDCGVLTVQWAGGGVVLGAAVGWGGQHMLRGARRHARRRAIVDHLHG
jgi:hypothetical protein